MVERWFCDVCNDAAFSNYDEACLHEASCSRTGNQEVAVTYELTTERSVPDIPIENHHPFFAPKKIPNKNSNKKDRTAPLTKHSRISASIEKKPTVASAPVFTLKTRATNVQRITSSSSYPGSDRIAPLFSHIETANRSKKEQDQVTKRIMGEQRAAEYMNKRRLEQEQELLRRNSKRQKQSAKKTEAASEDISQGKGSSFFDFVQPWLHNKAAPIFPVPSHIIPTSTEINKKSSFQFGKELKTVANSSKSDSKTPSIRSLLFTDDNRDNNALLYKAFRAAFFLAKDNIRSLPATNNLSIQDVCGEVNQQVCDKLLNFLEERKNSHLRFMKNKAPVQKKKMIPKLQQEQKYYKNKSIDDFDDDYEDEDCEEICDGSRHVVLIVGPSCGKTQLVHACAASLGNCHVLEINTSSPRGGAALRRMMEEATQSQSLYSSSQQNHHKNIDGSHESYHDKENDKGNSWSMPVLLLDEGE